MRALAILAPLALAGCVQPITVYPIYVHTFEPLTKDYRNTPLGERRATSDIKEIRYGTYIDIQWDSNAIGELGRQAGLDEVYYADLETVNIMGVWRQQRIILYGK